MKEKPSRAKAVRSEDPGASRRGKRRTSGAQTLEQSVVDSAAEAIVVVDLEGNIRLWNLYAERLFQRSARQMLGEKFTQLFPAEMHDRVQNCLDKAAAGQARENVELVYPASQARRVDLWLSSAPLESFQEAGVVLLLRDWSRKRKEIERINEENLELSETLGQLGLAHAELQETKRELELLTIFDDLTKLYNRRYFFHRAKTEFARALRYQHPLGLLLLDFDRFKSVNDELGHPFGDAVLRQAGMLVLGTIRTVDIAARYGGEEFVILAPDTPMEGLKVLGERLRVTFEEYTFVHEGQSRQVTLSAGGCAVPPYRFADLDEMLRRTDEMMYRAKETRNRVECEQG